MLIASSKRLSADAKAIAVVLLVAANKHRNEEHKKAAQARLLSLAVTRTQGRVIGADATLRKSVTLALRPDTWTV